MELIEKKKIKVFYLISTILQDFNEKYCTILEEEIAETSDAVRDLREMKTPVQSDYNEIIDDFSKDVIFWIRDEHANNDFEKLHTKSPGDHFEGCFDLEGTKKQLSKDFVDLKLGFCRKISQSPQKDIELILRIFIEDLWNFLKKCVLSLLQEVDRDFYDSSYDEGPYNEDPLFPKSWESFNFTEEDFFEKNNFSEDEKYDFRREQYDQAIDADWCEGFEFFVSLM
jgi:hypothetical protein